MRNRRAESDAQTIAMICVVACIAVALCGLAHMGDTYTCRDRAGSKYQLHSDFVSYGRQEQVRRGVREYAYDRYGEPSSRPYPWGY
ncbi:hypothetical protein [Planctomycetes bacterium TBK1r]|uniref:DUF4124 domain-containing protein n=1 Tax=Stieleria magnilauensis TaxID=2527963 RepID=A0ABX5XYA9_9BACT|nr:hypothetical protein TBK1r_59710 [Planctomycetes bacterium TBK1r]QDV87022.1 hypothetical protein TBK1r_60490 [Planctomycetes bacterium TBK1r]